MGSPRKDRGSFAGIIRRRNPSGVTLIELMLSLVLFSLFLYALFSLLRLSTKAMKGGRDRAVTELITLARQLQIDAKRSETSAADEAGLKFEWHGEPEQVTPLKVVEPLTTVAYFRKGDHLERTSTFKGSTVTSRYNLDTARLSFKVEGKESSILFRLNTGEGVRDYAVVGARL